MNKAIATNILVCDDESDILDMLRFSLAHAGYTVSTASTYDELMRRYRQAAPDLIMLDIRMPGHDGFWIADHLKSIGNRAPIVFLTAHDMPLYRMYAPIAGGVDFLTKPIDPDVLVARIEKALGKRAECPNEIVQGTK